MRFGPNNGTETTTKPSDTYTPPTKKSYFQNGVCDPASGDIVSPGTDIEASWLNHMVDSLECVTDLAAELGFVPDADLPPEKCLVQALDFIMNSKISTTISFSGECGTDLLSSTAIGDYHLYWPTTDPNDLTLMVFADKGWCEVESIPDGTCFECNGMGWIYDETADAWAPKPKAVWKDPQSSDVAIDPLQAGSTLVQGGDEYFSSNFDQFLASLECFGMIDKSQWICVDTAADLPSPPPTGISFAYVNDACPMCWDKSQTPAVWVDCKPQHILSYLVCQLDTDPDLKTFVQDKLGVSKLNVIDLSSGPVSQMTFPLLKGCGLELHRFHDGGTVVAPGSGGTLSITSIRVSWDGGSTWSNIVTPAVGSGSLIWRNSANVRYYNRKIGFSEMLSVSSGSTMEVQAYMPDVVSINSAFSTPDHYSDVSARILFASGALRSSVSGMTSPNDIWPTHVRLNFNQPVVSGCFIYD